MNCEICKNKKATLFYADESGIRHALCPVCGESINRLGNATEKKEAPPKYIPEPTLCSFLDRAANLSTHIKSDPHPRASCKSCGSTLESIIESGKFGCPDCYECFGDSIKLKYASASEIDGVRMPSSHRFDLDRKAMLENLRSELRGAIESEKFELAASIRDKIRRLEEKTKTHIA